ncbi:hypothetical protein ACQPW3_19870 [Actinosynnema sp. CA-248983]
MVDTGPTRFEVAVARVLATVFGVLVFVLAGMQVFGIALFIAPVAAPAVLFAAALGGGWLAVRGRPSLRAFGTGLVLGWALLAVWSSGSTLGLFLLD